jgi:TonB family protein
VSILKMLRILAVCVLLMCGVATAGVSDAWAQDTGGRKAKVKVTPKYPELARRMKIAGVVKIQITIAANGAVRDSRVVGGHPVLASAVIEAVQRWRFEAGPQETTENLEFRFDPNE